MRPVEKLDLAASEVARQNYNYRVPVDSQDELGRLAQTSTTCCASIQSARQELIRQERIFDHWPAVEFDCSRSSQSTGGHLRGAELLVDSELTAPQRKRLAGKYLSRFAAHPGIIARPG